MKNPVSIDALIAKTIYNSSTNLPPSAGINGELGELALKSNVDDLQNQINSNTYNLEKKLERDKTGILVPLYVYPTNGGNIPEFTNLIASKNAYHDVPLYVIINPGITPTSSLDLNYQTAIKRLKGCNAKVVGYVATTYTSAAPEYVKSQIDTWVSLYDIDGIMFDEMTSDSNQTHYDYYTGLTNYCHSKNLYPVIGNAGTTIPSGYFDANSADIYLVYEAAGYTSEEVMQNGYGGIGNYSLYPYTSRAHLFHSIGFSADDIKIAQKYTGLLYATSDTMPNPWDSITPYIESLFSTLSGNSSGGGGNSTAYTQNAGTNYSVKSGDNRTLAPIDVSGTTPGFQFMFGSVNADNNNPYADIITCSTWYDGTGGGINQLLFSKTDGNMYHKFGTFGASGWQWTRKILDDSNANFNFPLHAGTTFSISAGDIRTTAPSSYPANSLSTHFSSLNNNVSSPWADVITLNTYSDGSGGDTNQLLFSKTDGNMYHKFGTFGSGVWNWTRKIWDDGNMGDGSGLDADLLDGQHSSYYTSYSNSTSANAYLRSKNYTDSKLTNISGGYSGGTNGLGTRYVQVGTFTDPGGVDGDIVYVI